MNNHPNTLEKYSRQQVLEEIGVEGQKILARKKVAIVGIGALGTVVAELLARAGIGELLLIDRDIIEESNLQRQTLFMEQDVGKSKAVVAAGRLREINSSLCVTPYPLHLSISTADLLSSVDLVVDGTDNMETRFLLNDYCKKEKKKWVYGAAIRTKGYVMPILPEGPCLRCFLKDSVGETCDTVGILNTTTHIVASWQATLALQLLLGTQPDQSLYYIDVWNATTRKIKVQKDTTCPTCQGIFSFLQKDTTQGVIRFCSTGKFQVQGRHCNVHELKEKWSKIDLVVDDGVCLRFKNICLFHDGRALITAHSEAEALSLYARYVGV